jgi:GH24 family phage-related lysozyme (muramidase)
MTPSPACAALVKSFESCAKPLRAGTFIAYLPTPVDKWTLGYGSTGPDIVQGLVWTQAQCDARFASDLAKFGAGVSELLTGPTTQNEFDALVSFSYNVGLGNLKASTLLRMHNAGDHEGARAQFGEWVHQGPRYIVTKHRVRDDGTTQTDECAEVSTTGTVAPDVTVSYR